MRLGGESPAVLNLEAAPRGLEHDVAVGVRQAGQHRRAAEVDEGRVGAGARDGRGGDGERLRGGGERERFRCGGAAGAAAPSRC